MLIGFVSINDPVTRPRDRLFRVIKRQFGFYPDALPRVGEECRRKMNGQEFVFKKTDSNTEKSENR